MRPKPLEGLRLFWLKEAAMCVRRKDMKRQWEALIAN
jgi:hypothetical protein